MGARIVASIALAAGLAFGFVAAEWLFLVTMPSFLAGMPWLLRWEALFIGALPAIGAASALAGVGVAVAGLAALSGRLAIVYWSLALAPAVAVAVLLVTLLDNFSNTVLGVGLATPGLAVRLLGWAVVVVLAAWSLRWASRSVRRLATRSQRRLAAIALALLAPAALGGLFVAAGLQSVTADSSAERYALPADRRPPNIVIFGVDGVSSDHISGFGYERPTTPNLDAILVRSLVAENAFTNSARTTGALTALMTGRHATTTHVLYPPQLLMGEDAYLTLPRILRSVGYRAIQETARYYADGPDLNWREAFDNANRRVVNTRPPRPNHAFELTFQGPLTLQRIVLDRLTRRFGGLVNSAPELDAYAVLISREQARVYGFSDEDRLARVREFIAADDARPFFVHLHLMETHCCAFHPDRAMFSASPDLDDQALAVARFDDTIREADLLFGELLAELESRGILEQTIVVYLSDHSHHWDFRGRVPVVIRFPSGAHAGRLVSNVQLIDLAPTLLDYLGIAAPEWMEGGSLLRGEPSPMRPIFATTELMRTHFRTADDESLARLVGEGPPRYGLRQMGMVVCNAWYLHDLDRGTTDWGPVPDHTSPCSFEELPRPEAAAAAMLDHLLQRGFGVTLPGLATR